MNRQARVVWEVPRWDCPGKQIQALSEWQSYGNVTFFEAVRDLALQASDRKKSVDQVKIEVRDEHDPSIPPAVFDVEVTREARVLNPRQGFDKQEPKGFLASVWDLITGATK